jgi:hypothetical protein
MGVQSTNETSYTFISNIHVLHTTESVQHNTVRDGLDKVFESKHGADVHTDLQARGKEPSTALGHTFGQLRPVIILLDCHKMSREVRDSSVGIATGSTAGVRLPTVQDFSLLHSVHTGPGADPACYPMGTGGKAVGA